MLINGATGTSGGLTIRTARHLGAGKTIATGRNRGALAKLHEQGADNKLTLDALPAELPAVIAEGIDIVLYHRWGQSALDIMQAVVAGGEKRVRFVQIGSLSGQNIPLDSKLLRSSGLTLMGSGLGSISYAKMVASVGELLQAATQSDFSIPFWNRPLSEIETAWDEDDSHCRTVFII